MAKKYRIGIYFRDNPRWTGGVYYLQNLIRSLSLTPFPNEIEPVIIYCEEKEEKMIRDVCGDSIERLHIPVEKLYTTHRFHERLLNFAGKKIASKEIIKRSRTISRLKQKIDLIYPFPDLDYFLEIPEKLCWIPDFQHKALPDFFSSEERENRDKTILDWIEKKYPMVFSSESVRTDFSRFFPAHKNETFVLNFAVFHPDFSSEIISDLTQRYKLKPRYIYSPNQFWKHKNHATVIEAVALLSKKGMKDLQVVFSGNEHDYRFPGYVDILKARVMELDLTDQVLFLGFLKREEQLCIMKNAHAILQPSLFEGWSTVVEDAKALGKFVIASNLPVHKEQLVGNACFFEPTSIEQCARSLKEAYEKPMSDKDTSYETARSKFGKDFYSIIDSIREQNL